jgi:hypothetical protein
MTSKEKKVTQNKEQITLADLGVLKPGRGGRRSGAGRKPDGVTMKVSITLPEEDWDHINQSIERKDADSKSDYFRKLYYGHLRPYNETIVKKPRS